MRWNNVKYLETDAQRFDTATGPNLALATFLSVKFHDCIRPIHSMSLMSASNPVNVIGKVMLFVQMGDFHLHVY